MMLSRLLHIGPPHPDAVARLTGPVNVLLVLVLAYQLAGLTVTLPLLTPPSTPQPVTITVDKPTSPDQQGYRQLIGWHLFGAPQQTTAPAPADTPPTTLNLHLGGIIYRPAGDMPLALIAVGQRPETIYRVGATVAGARIRQILPDRVILARADHLEALQLPRPAGNAAPAVAPSSHAGRRVINATGLASQLRADPAALENLVHATPYWRGGHFVGLRLVPGQNHHLLNRLGLQPGDVLVALNGHPLSSPAESLTQLQQLLSAPRVRATILRDGNQIPLTFVLQ